MASPQQDTEAFMTEDVVDDPALNGSNGVLESEQLEEEESSIDAQEEETESEFESAASSDVTGSGDESSVPEDSATEDAGDSATEDADDSTTECAAVEDDKGIFLRNMTAGFEALRLRRETGSSGRRFPSIVSSISEDDSTGPIDFLISVNFIDPTTAGTVMTPPRGRGRQNFSLLSQLSSGSENASTPKPAPPQTLDLYEKLTSIFERDYSSTLHSIPYENIRNGARGTIEKLMIRSILTRSHSAGYAANGDANVPWGGTSATAAAPVSDPQEWHNGPYCHVYIAACESMEHYRSKVKPSLQAFVSQIESAANNASKGEEASGNYSPHYVIVYVPTGPKSTPGASPSPAAEQTKSVGAALASRLGSVRRRLDQSQNSSRELSSDSVHSQATSFDGTDSDYESGDLAAAPPPGPIALSSKLEKELYRKFTTDFPAGRTCIMSTLMDSVDDTSVATTSPLKNQEWSTFLHMLGSAIVSGFKDRCRRYDAELRRLDQHRAQPPSKKDAPRFNLSHFFLVKESLAFTYEQMRLPQDALLQYEELRAFLPEHFDDEEDGEDATKKKKKSRSKRKLHDFEKDEAMKLAIAGDSVGFRRRLRSAREFAPMAPIVLQYLFTRESSLLLQMEAPVAVMNRANKFVKTLYRMRVKQLHAMESKLSDEQKLKERIDTEIWALNFCWDMKLACGAYFSESDMVDDYQRQDVALNRSEDDSIFDTVASQDADTVAETAMTDGMVTLLTEKDLARELSDLLEFARIRLMKLGDTKLSCENPLSSLRLGLPPDMRRPWPPLDEVKASTSSQNCELLDDPTDVNSRQQRNSLLEGAFDSADAYESAYLEVTEAVVAFSRFGGRRRFASKLDGERAEIYIRKGRLGMAAEILLPIVDVCGIDQWQRGHFWRLFRLACCQRSTATAPMYLSTLTHSFGQRVSPVAPPKAMDLLQKDLEVVVGDAQVAEFPLGIAPFVETELVVRATSSGKSSKPLHYMRKKVINNFCLVGEEVVFELALTSHLYREIEVQAVRLFVVAFDKYEALFHSKTTITDSEAFEILSLDAPVSVKPGVNNYTFKWIPMITGEFVLSTVQIQWKSACFYYDSAALRRPLLGIAVTPSDPTHTLELNPLFLIRGLIQQVRIIFNSGADFMQAGTVQLLGFEGLQVIPPGMDPDNGDWRRSCEIPLPSCKPGETVVLSTFVKSSAVHGGDVQALQATVATTYYHAHYEDLPNEARESIPAMKSVLEATISTLDRPVLSVESASAFSYEKDRVMVSTSLRCNTPVPFTIMEWRAKLPKLRVSDDGDLNQGLFNQTVAEGEEILLSFNCIRNSGASNDDDNDDDDVEPTLEITLQDEFGKTCTQVVPLDLDEFYDHLLRTEEETSGLGSVTAELYCSADDGPVGTPVTFTYLVDISSLDTLRSAGGDDEARLLYNISCDTAEWILSGKVQGMLGCSNSSDISIEFVGIPVHPGVVAKFPEISLEYKASDADSRSIEVQTQLPEAFTSHAFVSHVALACPAAAEDEYWDGLVRSTAGLNN